MITYVEVKNSPSGWEDSEMSFESDLTALIDAQRNLMNKAYVSKVLVNASEQVEKDEGWIYDETHPQPVTEDSGE